MTKTINIKTSIVGAWFGLFMFYIMTSYVALDGLLPTYINSIALYSFLLYSAFAIIYSGKIKLTPILWWELICLLFALVAMYYSPSFSIFGGTYYSLIVNFIIVFILTQMPWNRARFNMIMKAFVVSSVGLMIILFVTGKLNFTETPDRFGSSLTGNANIFAVMLMMGAIYSIWLLISSKTATEKVLYLLSVVILYVGMFMSGGRKYVVIPIIFVYVLLVNKVDKKGKSHVLESTCLVILVCFVIYQLIMNVPMLYESIGIRFDEFFALFNNRAEADSSSLFREKMITAAFDKWKTSPLWGHGFDSFKYYNASSVTGHMYYSHNNFVELLYNQGIIGFIAYYSFYVYLIVKAVKIRKKTLFKGFVLAAIISTLVFEIFEVTYSITPTQLMLCFSYICLHICSQDEKAVSNEQD
ncbi:MAG: O-antigen ligase family protein [Ruminococcaceae bacterium]|nr:O-antigen ligase family protein [Oscillospiraceae bacterium]